MKNIKNIVLVLFVFISCAKMQAQEFKLDVKNSTLNWTGKAAFNSYAPKGTLKSKSGIFKLDRKVIKNLELVIDMKTLHHDNKDLKSHLRNKDFFEVKKYASATFKLIEPSEIIDAKATLIGNMTIKNMTNEEKIEVVVEELTNEVRVSYEISLDRTKYGVKFNSPSFFKKLKENAIADEFNIKGVFIFTKPQ